MDWVSDSDDTEFSFMGGQSGIGTVIGVIQNSLLWESNLSLRSIVTSDPYFSFEIFCFHKSYFT